MNKFLLYINEVLESLDIPVPNYTSSRKLKTLTKNHFKNTSRKVNAESD